MGRETGAPKRELPKLWINELFGRDLDRLKAMRLPPQVSLKKPALIAPVDDPWAAGKEELPLRPASDFMRLS